MPVTSFLNPFGSYIYVLERGSEFAYRKAIQGQTVRSAEDDFMAKLLKRPDEMAMLNANARTAETNAQYLFDTLGSRTSQENTAAIAAQLKVDLAQLNQPYEAMIKKNQAQLSQSNADFANLTFPDRVQEPRLRNEAISANVGQSNAGAANSLANRDNTLQQTQGLMAENKQAEILNTLTSYIGSAAFTPSGTYLINTSQGQFEISAQKFEQMQRQLLEMKTTSYRGTSPDSNPANAPAPADSMSFDD